MTYLGYAQYLGARNPPREVAWGSALSSASSGGRGDLA
jgi:hypothetical protein